MLICINSMVFGVTNAQKPYRLKSDFDAVPTPPKPDYGDQKYWCALPIVKDMADSLPRNSQLKDGQSIAQADVFFIHPTIFTYKPKNQYEWNADVNDNQLNDKVDNSTILNQSTPFNGSCKVYAPRYRQAHYSAFTTADMDAKSQSLQLAYGDIKAAFEYYLSNYNQGRPIVIAAHSQGTVHGIRLLKEFFDGKDLQKQLVEAYLVGIATPPDYFDNIIASDSAGHFGGFVSWNTFAKNYYPNYYNDGLSEALCTNPLSWQTNEVYAPREWNLGGVGLKYKWVEQPVDAQVNKGLLWINKPYVKGRWLLHKKIWHVADINLYWMNIRQNVALRLENYQRANPN